MGREGRRRNTRYKAKVLVQPKSGRGATVGGVGICSRMLFNRPPVRT